MARVDKNTESVHKKADWFQAKMRNDLNNVVLRRGGDSEDTRGDVDVKPGPDRETSPKLHTRIELQIGPLRRYNPRIT